MLSFYSFPSCCLSVDASEQHSIS